MSDEKIMPYQKALLEKTEYPVRKTRVWGKRSDNGKWEEIELSGIETSGIIFDDLSSQPAEILPAGENEK